MCIVEAAHLEECGEALQTVRCAAVAHAVGQGTDRAQPPQGVGRVVLCAEAGKDDVRIGGLRQRAVEEIDGEERRVDSEGQEPKRRAVAQGFDGGGEAGERAGVVRGEIGDRGEVMGGEVVVTNSKQAGLAAVDDAAGAVDEALAADLQQGLVDAAETFAATAGENDGGDGGQDRFHARRTSSKARPASRPQKAPPIPSSVMPEAVVTKVVIAGRRACSSASEALRAEARLGSRARPATASMRIGGDAAMKLAAKVEPRPRSR